MQNRRSNRIQQRLFEELSITPEGPNRTAVICEDSIAVEMLSFIANHPESVAWEASVHSERLGENLGVIFGISCPDDKVKQLSREFVASLPQERLHEIENQMNQSFAHINHAAL